MKFIIITTLFTCISFLSNAQSEENYQLQMQKKGEISIIRLAPDGSYFLTFEEGLIKVWDTATGRVLREIIHAPLHDWIHGAGLTFGKTYGIIYYAGWKYDVKDGTGKALPQYGKVTPDEKYIVQQHTNKSVYKYNIYSNTFPAQLMWTTSYMVNDDFEVSDDSKYLVIHTGYPKHILMVFDIPTGKLVKKIKPNEMIDPGYNWWLHADGKRLIKIDNGRIETFNWETLEHGSMRKGWTGNSAVILPDDKVISLFNGSRVANPILNYDDPVTGTNIKLTDSFIAQTGASDWSIGRFDVSLDAKYLVGAGKGKYGAAIFIYNLEKRQLIREVKTINNLLSDISSDQDGTVFSTSGDMNSARVWDLTTGRVRNVFNFPGIAQTVVSQDGKKVLYQSITNEKTWHSNFREYVDKDLKSSAIFDISSGDRITKPQYCYKLKNFSNGKGFYGYEKEYGGEMYFYDFDGKSFKEKVNFHFSDDNKDIDYKIVEASKSKVKQVGYAAFDPVLSPSGKIAWQNSKWRISGIGVAGSGFSEDGIRISHENSVVKINKSGEVWLKAKDIIYTHDESEILIPDNWKQVSVINSKTGDYIRSFPLKHSYGRKLAISSDDSKLLYCHNAGIDLIDYQSGNVLLSFDNNRMGVISAIFCDNEKRVLGVSSDQTIKLWDIATRELIMTFIPAGYHEFAAITPDYYYAGSKGIGEYLHFVNGMNSYGFENFDLALNRPDIVAERLGKASPQQIAAYKNAYLKRLKKMGFTEDQISGERHLPTVEILTKEIPFETAEGNFTFRIKGSDEKYKLDRINVYVNGVPIYGIKGQSIQDEANRTVEKEIILPLSSGNNSVQISVHNEKGAESIKESFSIVCSQKRESNTYVISIGISDYKDNEYDLNYAAKDANDIAAKFGTDASKVFKITDGNAVKEKVLAIKSELMKSKVDDRVILFVAGHGLLDDNLDYFIGMHDVDFENPAARGLPYEDLEGLLDGIPARKKLMFIDACHSGEVDKDDSELVASNVVPVGKINARGFKTVASKSNSLGLENSFALMQELFADLRKGTGAVVISSASGAEFALESDAWKNGVFTYSILEGLEDRKCDTDKDGAVQVSELKDYVFDRVAELTNGKQHPTSRRENLEFDFVVW